MSFVLLLAKTMNNILEVKRRDHPSDLDDDHRPLEQRLVLKDIP